MKRESVEVILSDPPIIVVLKAYIDIYDLIELEHPATTVRSLVKLTLLPEQFHDSKIQGELQRIGWSIQDAEQHSRDYFRFKTAQRAALYLEQLINNRAFPINTLSKFWAEVKPVLRSRIKIPIDEPFDQKIESIEKLLIEQRQKEEGQAIQDWMLKGKNPGYVYLVRSLTREGYWKIGCAKNPDNRVEIFEVKLPFEIELEHSIPTNDMRKAESKLHQWFADKRVKGSNRRFKGEWFALSDEDVTFIKSHKKLDPKNWPS